MTKLIMHGCNGKMGQVISKIVKEDPNVEMAAGIDAYTGIANDYPVFESIEKCDIKADAIVDFSNAAAVDGLLDYCVEKQVPVVLCTTGLSEEQLKKVEETSKKVAVLKSANMSLGVNMLLKLLQDAAKVLAPAGFDIEIVEKHHNQKIDAPSGTAKLLYDVIHEEIDETKEVYDRSQVHHKREKNEIGIQSVRAGTIFGEHTVLLAGHDEVIELKHTALSKDVFVQGAIAACETIIDKDYGLYTLKNLY